MITSKFQTNGKGQRGQKWESENNKNLLISLLIEPNISIFKQFNINKFISLALIDTLSSLGIDSRIKWPNDILVNKRKIAGILIQNIILNNIITHSVIGIGLNVNQLFFKNYNFKATSLELELYQNFFLKDIQNLLLKNIQNRLKNFREGLDADSEYLNVLFKKDQVSFFESTCESFNGIIRGVTERGLLIVQTNNITKTFNLKEVKMRS